MGSSDEGKAVSVTVGWVQLARFTAFALIVILIYKLANLILLALLGMMLAIALYPILTFLVNRKVPRGVAVFFITSAVVGSISAFFIFLFPPLLEQFSDLIRRLPEIRENLLGYFPPIAGLGG